MRWDVNEVLWLPYEELEFQFSRSSGPGGQNVNKVNSKALLRWNPTTNASLPPAVLERFLALYRNKFTTEGELLLQSDRHRDQKRNQEDCLEKLRELILRVALPPKKRKPTKPTFTARKKRLSGKRLRGETKRNRGKVHQD